MRFHESTYDEQIASLLDEFVDERVIEAIGDEDLARQQIGMVLGIAGMDIVEIGEDDYIITPANDAEIDRRLAIAREAMERGESIVDADDAGLFR
jgi:hypothetical protein